MKCEDINKLASAYIDGELSKDESKALETHIDTCGECRETLMLFEQMQTNIDTLDDIVLPETFHHTLMKRIQEENKINQQENKLHKEISRSNEQVKTIKVTEPIDQSPQVMIAKNKKIAYRWIGYVATLAALFIGAIVMVTPQNGVGHQEETLPMASSNMRGQSQQSMEIAESEDVLDESMNWDVEVYIEDVEAFEQSILEWSALNAFDLTIETIADENVRYMTYKGNQQELYRYLSEEQNLENFFMRGSQTNEQTTLLIKYSSK